MDSEDKEQILAAVSELTRMMIDKDIVGMDSLLDSSFTLTHITGYVQSKSEWYSEIESEGMRYFTYREVSTEVQLNRDTATFIGRNMLDARIWGMRNDWKLQQIMQLEKRNGKWVILHSLATTF